MKYIYSWMVWAGTHIGWKKSSDKPGIFMILIFIPRQIQGSCPKGSKRAMSTGWLKVNLCFILCSVYVSLVNTFVQKMNIIKTQIQEVVVSWDLTVASAQGQLIILNESAVELFVNAIDGICILAPPGSVSSVHIFSDRYVESALQEHFYPDFPLILRLHHPSTGFIWRFNPVGSGDGSVNTSFSLSSPWCVCCYTEQGQRSWNHKVI